MRRELRAPTERVPEAGILRARIDRSREMIQPFDVAMATRDEERGGVLERLCERWVKRGGSQGKLDRTRRLAALVSA